MSNDLDKVAGAGPTNRIPATTDSNCCSTSDVPPQYGQSISMEKQNSPSAGADPRMPLNVGYRHRRPHWGQFSQESVGSVLASLYSRRPRFASSGSRLLDSLSKPVPPPLVQQRGRNHQHHGDDSPPNPEHRRRITSPG